LIFCDLVIRHGGKPETIPTSRDASASGGSSYEGILMTVFSHSRPFPDFKKFSLDMASALVVKVSAYISFQGLNLLVNATNASLCCCTLCAKSAVEP
jgi:hypothetical protein